MSKVIGRNVPRNDGDVLGYVADKDALCALKGVRNMLESRVSKPGVRWAALSSFVAGLPASWPTFSSWFLCLAGWTSREWELVGSANDLVGSLGTAFKIPVALALSAWLPEDSPAGSSRC